MFVGQDIPRLDGEAKLDGSAIFVDDIQIPGLWHGAVVRSPIAHGRIKRIELDPAFDWDRVVTASARDIPGRNRVAMIEEDMPLIADDIVRHVGEAILLIAAPTRELALEARERVRIEFEEWEPCLSIEEARLARVKVRGGDNVIARLSIAKGDAAAALGTADRIIEGTYSTGHQEHIYLEPQGAIAAPLPGGRLEVVGSMQCPYYVSRALSIIMGLPEERFAVRQAAVGGAFGGKEDYPSILAGFCTVLAWRAGRPVKIVYERGEDTAVTTKRHPAIVRHRTGVTRDGRIAAMEISVELDGGAYATLTPVVLSRAIIHSAGPYRCENVLVRGTAYATNTPPNGAFRGFGAPQVLFALEAHMDRIAEELGLSPLDLRRRNCLRPGDTTATGQRLDDGVGALAVLEDAARRSDFERRRADLSAKGGAGGLCRGIGMSLFFHGAGFTGSGEAKIRARAGLRLDGDGRVVVLTSCTELGQGSQTALAQIAADALGVDISCVGVETPDTSLVPDSGPTVASRTTLVVGGIILKCAAALRERLIQHAAEEHARPSAGLSLAGDALMSGAERLCAVQELVKGFLARHGPLTIEEVYEPPPGSSWDEASHSGDAYPAYAWGAFVALVDVDGETFEVHVAKMWLSVEVGRAINPGQARGQIEGGALQSLGLALTERHEAVRGEFKTNRMRDYLIPTSLDAPIFETVILEEPFARGPMGAKGLGELPASGAAPAIANAVAHATGIRISDLPITPEKLHRAIHVERGEATLRSSQA